MAVDWHRHSGGGGLVGLGVHRRAARTRQRRPEPSFAMNDAAGLAAIVAAMSEPGFYPQRPARVDVVQTHISYVFIAGEDVYKLKKPVRFAFLDFSTLEKRRHFCDEEVRL